MSKIRNKRSWHPNFLKYMRFIVGHKSYADMPNKFKKDGGINWVSPSDKKRARWWDRKVKELGLTNRAEVARAIHPKELHGLKPCQICGRKLSIFYDYPNKITLKKLNMLSSGNFGAYKETIDEICKQIVAENQKNGYEILRRVFDVPQKISNGKLLQFIRQERRTRLSPGVMSNPPDRLDGFHTYNACHRSKEDTGRLTANLSRYTQDRRAYENWADGNWNLSNRLMGEFKRHSKYARCPSCGQYRKMTPDHIGPISLGFAHRPKFNPLCNSCNSRKNNRITLADIRQLLKEEKQGETVISWHSKSLWDSVKGLVKSENDALTLSKVMRTNLHHILVIFSMIKEAGFDEFLRRFLHPEYSFYDYRFEGFNPTTGPKKVIAKKLSSVNKKKNAQRYVRISFQSLDDYKEKNVRNQRKWQNPKVDKTIDEVLSALRLSKFRMAKQKLQFALNILTVDARKIFLASRST